MKKIISLITVFCMLFSMFTVSSFASIQDADVQVYVNKELGGKLVRTVQTDGTITAEWIGDDGETATAILYSNGGLYVDGKLIGNLSMGKNLFNSDTLSPGVFTNADTITWGKWNNFSEKIRTGGLAGASLVVAIGTIFPELIPSLVGQTIITIQQYDYILVKGRIRYGSDSTYTYYERYTNMYGNGTDKLLPSEVYSEGRERL